MATRNRQSAKQAGARFERAIADYLAAVVDDRIDRRVKTGAKDRGDIGGVRIHGGKRVVIECKDHTKLDLAGWVTEALTETINDGALAGVVVHKRRGKSNPADQYVTMTLAHLAALLTGKDVSDSFVKPLPNTETIP